MRVWVTIGLFSLNVTLGQLDGAERVSRIKQASISQCEKEVATIDAAILELIELRNKKLAHAAWAQNQGDRLQFHPHNLLDARRYWREAEECREIAACCQSEINQLEDRKKALLKEKIGAPRIPNQSPCPP